MSSVRSRRMSRKMSMKEPVHESDRQLKKLFRAIQDGDVNLVSYLFGWDDTASSAASLTDLCHPLCQCDRCSRLRKTTSTAVLSVNCSDVAGSSPLHKASLNGHRVLVDMLLKHGALINLGTNETNMTPLHMACQYNQKDVVLLLLEHNALLDPRDMSSNTPLHWACSNGHMETAALLLMHGADVTLTNLRGDTPLHNASRWNHPMLVNELLLYGASYTATNNGDATPGNLTSDNQVLDLIRQAMSGRLAVGSYSPLTQSFDRVEHRKYSSQSEVSDSGTLNHSGTQEHLGKRAQSILPTKSGRTVSSESSDSKSSSFEYVQAPQPDSAEEDKVRRVIVHSAGISDVEVGSYEVIEGSEQMKAARAEGEMWSDHEEDEVTEGEDGGVSSCDEEHRPLSRQERSQAVDQSGASESRMLQAGAGDSDRDGSVAASAETTDSITRQGEKKLIVLLHAIEAFDRSTLNRRFRSKDKVAPPHIPLPTSPSPPPFMHDSFASTTPTTEAFLPTSSTVATPSLPSSPLSRDLTLPSSLASTQPSPTHHATLHSSIALHSSVSSSLSPTHSLPPAQEFYPPMMDEEELQTAGLGVSGHSPADASHF